jgi:GT2 family glycosyltransferase
MSDYPTSTIPVKIPVNEFEYDLTVSIVLFETDLTELDMAITLILRSPLKTKVYLIDNSATDALRKITAKHDVEYIFNNKNIGYGSGHNVGIKKAEGLAEYHLVMNADVDFSPAILEKAFVCMEDNPDIGLISPMIRLRSGEMQQFCRLLPTPFDLFARRFIPGKVKPLFKKKLDEYVLAGMDYSKAMNIPNLPGCFMFMRMADLKKVNGFDENIFLYVEDIDLTRRLHQISKTVYYPEIEIVHGLARGSYKLSKLVLYHINSAIYYFNKWGWTIDNNRRGINKQILTQNAYVQIRKTIQLPVLHKTDPNTEPQRIKTSMM